MGQERVSKQYPSASAPEQAWSALRDEQGRDLLAREQAARLAAEVAERRARFLSNASMRLASTLDPQTTLAQFVDLIVPDLADLCILFVLPLDRRDMIVATTAADPAKQLMLDELRRRYLTRGRPQGSVMHHVLQSGVGQLYADVDDALLQRFAIDDEHLRRVRQLEYRSVIVVPLVTQGQSIGLIMMGTAESGRRYEPLDLGLAEELAQRGAVALENARLYHDVQAELDARRRTEAALRASEERFRLLVAEVQDYAIFMLDPDGHIISWNAGAQRIKGYRAEEIIGQHFERFYTPPDRARGLPAEQLRCALADGRCESQGIRLRKDGSTFWAHVVVTALYDEQRQLQGFAKVTRDITAQKQAEDALRWSEQRYRTLVAATAQVVWSANVDGKIETDLPAWRAYTGQSPEQVLGWGWLDALHPDDRERTLKVWQQAYTNRLPYATEYRVLCQDGGCRDFTVRGVPVLNDDGTIREWIGACTDITERKQAERALREAEARLRTVVANVPVILFAIDRDGVFTLSEGRGLQAVGVQPGAVVGLSIFEVYAHEPVIIQNVCRALAGEVVTWQVEVRGIIFDTKATPLRDEDGVIDGLICVGFDVTERVRVEQVVRELNATLEGRVVERTAQLREVNTELEAFAYTVAHDLRAPLRGLQGLTQALHEDFVAQLDPLAHEYMRLIMASAAQMDLLIQDLLAYSRLSRTEIQPCPVSLHAVVHDALAQVATDIAARDGQVHVVEPLPDVLGHHATLVQVVANLLSNAAKFVVPDAQPQIEVRAERLGSCVRLWIRDHGIGIAPEHHAQIFGVFERLHGVETYPGTGIGLALVRKGVERMGGTVGVVSEPGQGSEFWFELPEATR